jgi:O-antigen/teichoic acid export membrane protein
MEYLGVNGLFSNVLSFLALTESGVGVAMAYSLYQPIADNKKSKISGLMNFYKKIYVVIASGVGVLGLILVPVLPYLVKESSFSNNQILIFYLFFLADNIASYFLAYKTTFLNANQENYIVTLIRTIVMCAGIVVKSIVLIVTGNFLLYLTITIITTIMNNLVVSSYVTRKYPYIHGGEEKPSDEDKKQLVKNIKGLFLHKIGAFAVFGTDNIIISMFISLKTTGIYSNYSLIFSQLNSIASQIFNALIPSMGNYIAVSTNKKAIYSMYKNILCLNFLLYGFFTSVLACVIQPFMKWWIGTEGLLAQGVVYLLLIDFYLKGMRNTTQIVKTAGGIFYEDRFSPLIEAVVNLVISIVLVNKIGIAGVFIGTIVSGLIAPFWITPYYLYKDLLEVPFREYFKDMLGYFLLLMVSVIVGLRISKMAFVDISFLSIIIQVLIISLFDIVFYCLILHKKNEFKYLLSKVKISLKQKRTK